MGNNGTMIITRWMCEYSLQLNLNGLKWKIVCNLKVKCLLIGKKQIIIKFAPTKC
jgi:hypothetical protein